MKRRPFSAYVPRGAIIATVATAAVLGASLARADELPAAPAADAPAPPPAPSAPAPPPASSAPAPAPAPSASVAAAPSTPAPAAELPPVTPALAVAPPPASTPAPAPAATPTLDPSDPDAPERRPVKHVYRKGFMLTLVMGGALGQGSGYPNDVQKVGNPDYFSRSPVMPGSSFQIVVGGALTDYFNFGFLVGGTGFKNDEWEVRATTVGFRIEAFPAVLAFPRSKALANLGIGGDFGAGTLSVQATGNYPGVAGFQTMLGVGAFYEFKLFSLLGGHVSISPEISYKAAYHTSSQINFGNLTARLSFYGGP